jgi:hypothetical protein
MTILLTHIKPERKCCQEAIDKGLAFYVKTTPSPQGEESRPGCNLSAHCQSCQKEMIAKNPYTEDSFTLADPRDEGYTIKSEINLMPF